MSTFKVFLLGLGVQFLKMLFLCSSLVLVACTNPGTTVSTGITCLLAWFIEERYHPTSMHTKYIISASQFVKFDYLHKHPGQL